MIGIVGCGLVGKKRALALPKGMLTSLFDVDAARCAALARELGRPELQASSFDELLAASEAVVIATTNDALVPLAIRAAKAGKHVLIEKPGARSGGELEDLIAIAES